MRGAPKSPSPRTLVRLGALLLATTGAVGCASVRFERETPTSGTFHSTAWAFTILSFDLPAPALSIARGNAADGGHPNVLVEHESVIPYLGPFDWILDILMVRRASVSGTWGYPSE